MSSVLDTAAARAYLKSLFDRLQPRSETHAHLDAFLDEMPKVEDRLAITKELFALGCDVAKEKRDSVLCFAVIGLRPDEELDVRPPSDATWNAELADEDAEPPAIYFVPRDVGQVLQRHEEYRRPCVVPGFMGREDWYPEYRTYRSAPDDLFWRGIWVHDLPPAYRA